MMSFASVLSELEERGEIDPEEWTDFDPAELFKMAQREHVPWKKVRKQPVMIFTSQT